MKLPKVQKNESCIFSLNPLITKLNSSVKKTKTKTAGIVLKAEIYVFSIMNLAVPVLILFQESYWHLLIFKFQSMLLEKPLVVLFSVFAKPFKPKTTLISTN